MSLPAARPPLPSPRPPRTLLLLLRCLPRAVRVEASRDLIELYAIRVGRRGRAAANRWFIAACFGFPARKIVEPVRLLGDQFDRILRFLSLSSRQSVPQAPDTDRQRIGDFMSMLLQDIRYAVRTLRQTPLFTLVAVSTLALGVGVNSTIFAVVNTLLFRPLPVHEPRGLVEIYSIDPDIGIPVTSSFPDYQDLMDGSSTLTDIAAHQMLTANMVTGGTSRLVYGELVSGNYFEMLGIRPHRGRLLQPTDDGPAGTGQAVVLGHGFWQQLGGTADLIGSVLRLNGREFRIVGVAPREFSGLVHVFRADIWLPLSIATEIDPIGIQSVSPSPTGTHRLDRRGSRWLMLKGRLSPGATADQANAELAAVMQRSAAVYPETNDGWGAQVVAAETVRLHPLVDGYLAPAAALVLGMVGLVLLIACTNLAGMLLSRASGRRREIAIRLALGASRGRLIRQLVTESLVLASAGGAAGLVVAAWSRALLLAVEPPVGFALRFDVPIDGRVVVFTLGVSLLSGLLFGLAPAFQAVHPDLSSALRNAGHGGLRRASSIRRALVVVQVAVCVVLLVGAALMVRSTLAAQDVDVGFETRGLAVLTIDLDLHAHPDDRWDAFFAEARRRLEALPGVRAVGIGSRLPFALGINTNTVFIEGQHQAGDPGHSIEAATVDRGYFDALGLTLLRGRGFDASDTRDEPAVAIVTAAAARKYWPAGAVGERFHHDSLVGPEVEIVGVVADYKVRTVGELPRPYIHYARSQSSSPHASIALRIDGDLARGRELVRSSLREMEPELVFLDDTTMGGLIGMALFPVRATASMLAAFGLLALLLAAVGLYGVIALSVSQRTREIGVRMALGARRGDVLGLVVGEGMRLTLVGVVIGVVSAAAMSRALASLMYGAVGFDAAAFGLAVTILLLVAALANYLPARQASRVDPLQALRKG